MTLFTKCIFIPKVVEDGVRVSVMSRHTLNDGKTSDARIVEGVSYDQWNRTLAPPGRIVGAHYRNEISWEEFTYEYRLHLQHERVAREVYQLASWALNEPVTILCCEETHEKCHRGLLAAACKQYIPDLSVIHRSPSA